MFSTDTLNHMIEMTTKAISSLRYSLALMDQSDEIFPQAHQMRHELVVRERRLGWLLQEQRRRS